MISAKLFICIIEKTERLNDVLEAVVECGVTRASIVDVRGMFEYLTEEIPLFSGFKTLIDDPHPTNKMVISVMKNDEKVQEVMDVIEEIYGDFAQPNTGIMFSLDINTMRGLKF